MPSYSWQLPAPPTSPPPIGGSATSAVVDALLETPLVDIAIDPQTRDFIDTPDGGILETADSRTAVMFQMETDLNGWWADPTQGSRIRAILNGAADPSDVQQLVDEVKRCLQPLVDELVIGSLKVSTDVDEVGRPVVLIAYSDGTTGTPTDIAYVPFDF